MIFKNKNNYLSWEIDPKKFPEDALIEKQIEFLLCFGILAPSGHNSQPWEFKIVKNSATIKINPERSLSESDPMGRQLSISFGCLLENILIAADYFGFSASFNHGSQTDNIFGHLTFNRKSLRQNSENHLINLIPKRQTNRFEYKNNELDTQTAKSLFSGIEPEITYELIKGEKKNSLGELMCEAQISAMESNIFREELSGFLKSSWTNSYVGMTGSTLGIPLVVSFFAPFLIKKVNLAKNSKQKDLELLTNHTPYIGVLLSKEDNKNTWTKVGQSLERIWLTATQNDLALGPLAAAAQIEIYRQKVKHILGTNLFPQAIFRLGYPKTNAAHSPRFLITKLLS